MEKTKFQDFIFSVIMVISMVYCMTVYNMALENGFTVFTLWNALRFMWPEVIVAFFVQRYIGKKVANRVLHKLIDVKTAKPSLISVCIAVGNVIIMAPCMTLLVNMMKGGIGTDLIDRWLPKLVVNFPFALCVQIFYVGPFVRLVYGLIFERKKAFYFSNKERYGKSGG